MFHTLYAACIRHYEYAFAILIPLFVVLDFPYPYFFLFSSEFWFGNGLNTSEKMKFINYDMSYAAEILLNASVYLNLV